jgi:hypothetical protein
VDDESPLALQRCPDSFALHPLFATFNVHEDSIINRPEESPQAFNEGRVDCAVTQQAVHTRP